MATLKAQEGYKNAMKELGMEWLDTESVMAAINDPKGPEAQKLFGKLADAASQLGMDSLKRWAVQHISGRE